MTFFLGRLILDNTKVMLHMGEPAAEFKKYLDGEFNKVVSGFVQFR